MIKSNPLGYSVLSQSVKISRVDFEQCTFAVSTEIALIALRSDVTSFALSLGKDCLLPNEPNFGENESGRVTVNDVDANYYRNSLNLIVPEDRSLAALRASLAEAQEIHLGDLIVEIPPPCLHLVQNQKVMTLNIDVIVYKPREAVKFVFDHCSKPPPPTDATEASSAGADHLSGAHLFTYRSNCLSSTKQWLPCADHPAQLCVWRFEITVPRPMMTAICCGDLVDTTVSEEEGEKTFHYQLLIPTTAGNIGFVLGDFQMYVQPEMPEIISFVPPQLMPLLRHTMSSLNRIFVFFEELLSCRFPYGTYWQVFVDQTPEEVTTFAGLSLFSVSLLYHKKILDTGTVQHSRQCLAGAVARQFFGCFLNCADCGELWLIRGLASFLTAIFVERFFGLCEHMFQLQRLLREACDFERRFGPITLRQQQQHAQQPMPMTASTMPMSMALASEDHPGPSSQGVQGGQHQQHEQQQSLHFDARWPDWCSPMYVEALAKKGHFLIRMLEKRLPKEQFMKVLQRILSIGMQSSQHLNRPADWAYLLLSTRTFMRCVAEVTGQEFPSFLDQWVDTGGHVQFHISHTFNRKRNMVELEVRQASPPAKGCQSYAGPLTVVVQELDGHFVHTVQVDAVVSRHDIQCHSKGRKLKRKRIVLGTGEEAEMDLAQMDSDSPVLWIRIDPELLLFCQMSISQPLYQWEFLLLYERDVLAQHQAIEALQHFPRHQTKAVLEEAVRNDKFFHRIRKEAAFGLVHIYNSLPDSQLGEQPPLIDYFRQQFCCKTCPDIPQPNNYVATAANLQNYLMLQALPSAIGSIRGQGGKMCPDFVVDFLLGLHRLNDNSANRYSDDHYRGVLLQALGKTLVLNRDHRPADHPEAMGEAARSVLAEVSHALNMDTMKPSFGRIISIHCMQLLYELQRTNHIAQDTEVFWKFGLSKHVYAPLRFAALACIVAMLRRSRLQALVGTVLRLVDVALNDPSPYIRHSVAHRLCVQPPFEHTDNVCVYPMNTRRLCQALWTAISTPETETRVRNHLADLYFLLYGTGVPGNFSAY